MKKPQSNNNEKKMSGGSSLSRFQIYHILNRFGCIERGNLIGFLG